jgi:hypothetical protein
MLLDKYIIDPVDGYLNDWFNALPFEAIEKILDVSIYGHGDVDRVLDEVHYQWESETPFMEKVGIHDTYWEQYEAYTNHLEIPHLIVRQKEWEY